LEIFVGAEDAIRTRDPDLGKVVLYQLSYFRLLIIKNFRLLFAFPQQLWECKYRGHFRKCKNFGENFF